MHHHDSNQLGLGWSFHRTKIAECVLNWVLSHSVLDVINSSMSRNKYANHSQYWIQPYLTTIDTDFWRFFMTSNYGTGLVLSRGKSRRRSLERCWDGKHPAGEDLLRCRPLFKVYSCFGMSSRFILVSERWLMLGSYIDIHLATYVVVCRPRPDCLIVSRCSSPATFFGSCDEM